LARLSQTFSLATRRLITNIPMPLAYFRYMDDTFAAFSSEEIATLSLTPLISSTHLYGSDIKGIESIPFLDVLVKKKQPGLSHRFR